MSATPSQKKAAPEQGGASTPAGASVDWERIELDYRAGVKSLREIAQGSGVSHVTISKKAKAMGWTRDLSAKIQQKADELVNKSLVNSPVNTANAVSERETIDANAQAIAAVKLTQRRDISRTRSITMALLKELELQTGQENVELLRSLGEVMRSENEQGQDRMNDLYQKVISLPGRAKTMKDLGESLRVLIALERQAFGLDDKDNTPVDPFAAMLNRIAQGSASGFKPVACDPDHDNEA